MTDLSELDRLLAEQDIAPPSLAGPVTERKCRRHRWYFGSLGDEPPVTICMLCGVIQDPIRSRRGKQSRNYGNRAELTVARAYGGVKIGAAGGPVDVQGKDFDTQVKSHRREPPREWTKAFAAMSAGNRCSRMLLRFVGSPGVTPRDYFVFQAKDFLDWFGRDE